MQMHDDVEATSVPEYSEQREYMGVPPSYGPFAGQPFQQHAYYPPMMGYGPDSFGQQQFAGAKPLSDTRFSAILSYAFGWVTGLLFLLFGGKNRFVSFHALQALVFFGALNVVDFGLFSIIREAWWYHGHLVALLCLFLFLVFNFIAFVSWVVVMIQAARGVYFRLPFVGELVARCLGVNAARPRW